MQEPAGFAGAGPAPPNPQPPFHWSQQQQDPALRPQRRTKAGRLVSTITKEELESCFHMPSEQACRHLGVGLTILKRVCRRFGIPRWPYNRQGRPEDGGMAESNGVYSHSNQQGPSGFAPAVEPGAGPQPFLQTFPQQLQGPQPNQAYAHAASTTAATLQPDWQQQQLQQALSSLFPQQQQQQQQPASLAVQPAGVAQFGGLPLQGQQGSNQLLQATIAALQAAPPGTLSSPAVQSLLSSLLGGALGGALAAGLQQQAPTPPAPSQWGGLLALSQPAGSLVEQQAAPGGGTLQQLAALLEQPAVGRGVAAPVHPQPQPSNPTTASALLSALGAGAAQSQPASRPAAGLGAGSASFVVRAAAVNGKLCGAAAAAAAGAAANTGTVPSKPSSAQQDVDGWCSGGDSQGEDDEDLADFLEPGAMLPPKAGTLPPHPSAAAPPAPVAVASNPATTAPAATMQLPVAQPPTSTAPPAVTAQQQAQPAKAEQLEQQLLAALPDLQETATLLRKAASQLQSHLLAQRLLKEHTASLGTQLPGSCQLLGVNAELAELCCTTLLNMLHGEGVAIAAAVQAGAQKHSGSATRTASGSGEQPSAPPQGSPQVQPGSSMAVGRHESHLSDEASPKRLRCSSPAPAPAAPS